MTERVTKNTPAHIRIHDRSTIYHLPSALFIKKTLANQVSLAHKACWRNQVRLEPGEEALAVRPAVIHMTQLWDRLDSVMGSKPQVGAKKE